MAGTVIADGAETAAGALAQFMGVILRLLAYALTAGVAALAITGAVADRAPRALVYPARRTELSSAACPVTDNMPYPPDCLSFLTGPFWRPE